MLQIPLECGGLLALSFEGTPLSRSENQPSCRGAPFYAKLAAFGSR